MTAFAAVQQAAANAIVAMHIAAEEKYGSKLAAGLRDLFEPEVFRFASEIAVPTAARVSDADEVAMLRAKVAKLDAELAVVKAAAPVFQTADQKTAINAALAGVMKENDDLKARLEVAVNADKRVNAAVMDARIAKGEEEPVQGRRKPFLVWAVEMYKDWRSKARYFIQEKKYTLTETAKLLAKKLYITLARAKNLVITAVCMMD